MPKYILIFSLFFFGSCTTSSFDRGHLLSETNGPAELKFDIVENLIILEAEVNGVEGRFLFDNGFSLSAVNADFAEKAKISFNKSSHIKDANNKRAGIAETTVDTVNIKNYTFVNTGFYRINTKKFLPCDSLDGVIGASIINKVNWEIDFKKQKIKLSSLPFDNEGFEMDISFNSVNSSFVNIFLNGQAVKSKIDFGRSGDLKYDYDHVHTLFSGYKVEKHVGIMSLSATGLGNEEVFYELADKINLEYDGQSLPVGGRILLSQNLKYKGYIGIDYFDDFLVTINSTKKQYILSEPTMSIDDKKEEKSYGIAIYPIEDKWKIIRLNPNDALLKGIEVMNEVVMLDDAPVNRFKDICAYYDYMEGKAENEESLRISLKGIDKVYELPYRIPVLTTL